MHTRDTGDTRDAANTGDTRDTTNIGDTGNRGDTRVAMDIS